ncbi:MAG: hypothetical protein ACLTE8_05600 [Christensenellales bacterium]
MTTKTEIKKDLMALTGKMVITAPQLAKIMSLRESLAYDLCRGCTYDPRSKGKQKNYYIADVSERLAERRMI